MECELCGQYEVLAKVLVDALEDAERALAHCYDCFDSIIAALALRDVRAAIDIAKEVLGMNKRDVLNAVEVLTVLRSLDKDDAHWDGIHGPYCDDCWEEMN